MNTLIVQEYLAWLNKYLKPIGQRADDLSQSVENGVLVLLALGVSCISVYELTFAVQVTNIVKCQLQTNIEHIAHIIATNSLL